MSFFFTKPAAPASCVSRFEKPREDLTSESGVKTRRRTDVAYWQGSYNYRAQKPSSTLLGELERADAEGGSFYADLYNSPGPQPAAVWVACSSMEISSFEVPATAGDAYGEGKIVAFRSSLGREFVTARIITGREAAGGGARWRFTWSTPLPVEFASTRPGVVFEVCFNRPHVRAKITTSSVQWTSQPREMRPLTLAWVEDTGANIISLDEAAKSAVAPGVPPSQQRFFINEDDTSFLVGEDGRFLVTEE